MSSAFSIPRFLQYLLLLATLLFYSVTYAQGQPEVPCPDCESRIHRPYPSSGAWANNLRPGSGFNLEVQNGFLIGFYYGYDEFGQATWYLFNGLLTAPEGDNSILWTFEAPLLHFNDGNCFSCPYDPPDDPLEAGTVRFEFSQRDFGNFQFNDGPKENMRTLLYGSPGFFAFEEHTNYIFPELGGDGENAAPWIVLLSASETGPGVPNSRVLLFLHFLSREFLLEGEEPTIRYNTLEDHPTSDPIVPFGNVRCKDFTGNGEVECEVNIGVPSFRGPYRMPIGNLSSDHFFGENSKGQTAEGFRVEYD